MGDYKCTCIGKSPLAHHIGPAPGFEAPLPGLRPRSRVWGPAPGFESPAPGFEGPAPGFEGPAPGVWAAPLPGVGPRSRLAPAFGGLPEALFSDWALIDRPCSIVPQISQSGCF